MAALTLATALAATPAAAAEWYLHSGDRNCAVTPGMCSLMEVRITDMNDLVIAYSRPKPTLASIGIGPGELLVSGRLYNGQLVGTARRYKLYGTTRCSLSYQVRGVISQGQGFVLQGPAPNFHPNRCGKIGELSMDNDQSVLTFTYIGSGQTAPNVSYR
ncbi:MAG: hypothetical protein AAB734_01450 [Patescibacteria group bacterium]